MHDGLLTLLRDEVLRATQTEWEDATGAGASEDVVLARLPLLPAQIWLLAHLSDELAAVAALMRKVNEEERAARRLDPLQTSSQMSAVRTIQQMQSQKLLAIQELRVRAYGKVVVLRAEDGRQRVYRIAQANYGLPDVEYSLREDAIGRRLAVINRLSPVASKLVSASLGEVVELRTKSAQGEWNSEEFTVEALIFLERYHGHEIHGRYDDFRLVLLDRSEPRVREKAEDALARYQREVSAIWKSLAGEVVGVAPLPPVRQVQHSDQERLGAHFYTQTTRLQEDLLQRPSRGLVVVGGVAGSGKTSVALGRTKVLCDRTLNEDEDEAGFFRPETAVGFVLSDQLSTYLKQTCERLSLHGMPVKEYLELRSSLRDARSATDGFNRDLGGAMGIEGRMAWLRTADVEVARAVADRLDLALVSPPAEQDTTSNRRRSTARRTDAQNTSLHLLWKRLVASLSSLCAELRQPASSRLFRLERVVLRLDRARAEFARQLEAEAAWTGSTNTDLRQNVRSSLRERFIRVLCLQDRYAEVSGGVAFQAHLKAAGIATEEEVELACRGARTRLEERKLSDADVDVILCLYHSASMGYRGRSDHDPISHLEETSFYSQVFVDEYQDFSEVQLFLMAAQSDPKRRAVTIVGDARQRLQQRHAPSLDACLADFSAEERRPEFLLENKRQSAPLARLSHRFREVILGESFGSLPPADTGGAVQWHRVVEDKFSDAVLEAIGQVSPSHSVAVLCASEHSASMLFSELQEDLKRHFREPRLSKQADLVRRFYIHFTTPLQAKGLEFDAIIIAGLQEFDLRDPVAANSCYVALSRARSQLILVTDSHLDHRLVDLLQDCKLSGNSNPPNALAATTSVPAIHPTATPTSPPPPAPTPQETGFEMTNDEQETAALRLLDVYESRLKGQLIDLGQTDLGPLEQAASVLRSALERRQNLRVGFLGEAQVGKSTLINALLGQRALPSGGVGPLTAQATTVGFAPFGSLSAAYHDRKRFNQFVFGLQCLLRRDAGPDDIKPVEDDDSGAWVPVTSTGDESIERDIKARGRYLLSQARLMLCDSADSSQHSAEVLFDGMRAVLDFSPLGDRERLLPLWPRIQEIRAKLGERDEVTSASLPDKRSFSHEVRLRAAGWMSPLVAKLDLALDNALLQSITLVDLPGVGVIGDPAGRVAEEFVRTQADALVIVARNNGLTEAIGGVLERTGVVTKLLFGGNEDIPAISIIIAITQLDEVTKDHYSREAAAAQESDDPLPDRHAIFERLAAQMSDKVKQQIFDALQASPAFDELPEPQRLRRESIINDLCRRMQVLCVSAPDYNYLLLNQEELAFLKRRETTHIPAFQGALRQLSEAAAVARQARIAAAQSSLQALILQFTEQLEIDDRARPTPESGWEIFRTKLEEKASSLKDQANTNRLSVGKFLREDMPQRLDTLSKEAASHADKRLASLKRKGEQLHYQSLNAALTRDGKFEDRNIDYPEALTRSLVDTIAGAWEPTVVEEVRQAVQRLATQDMALVRELYDHAKLLDAGAVDPQRLEVLQKTLDQQAKTTIEWTGDQLEKLRTDVHDQLHSVALKPIEKACRRAVDSAENRGLGAKTRILDAFHNGGLRAIEGAREKALEVLGLHFQKLQSQLTRSVLRRNYDPVRIAFDSLVSEDVASAHRGGNEEHARRTAQIQQLVHEVAQITAALTAPSPSALPHAAREEPPVLQPGSNARSAGNDMFADLGRRS